MPRGFPLPEAQPDLVAGPPRHREAQCADVDGAEVHEPAVAVAAAEDGLDVLEDELTRGLREEPVVGMAVDDRRLPARVVEAGLLEAHLGRDRVVALHELRGVADHAHRRES